MTFEAVVGSLASIWHITYRKQDAAYGLLTVFSHSCFTSLLQDIHKHLQKTALNLLSADAALKCCVPCSSRLVFPVSPTFEFYSIIIFISSL